MLKILYISLLVFVSLVVHSSADAKDVCVGDCASCHMLSVKEAEELLKKTGGTVKSIKQAPIRGMFELFMEKDGKQGIIYIDYAKKNFMQGFIVNFETLKKISAHDSELPQPKQTGFADLKSIPTENAFVMGNPLGTKKLYIFTDPESFYCRQQHVELIKLEKIAPDLAIYVLLYPLPMNPGGYDKSRSVLTLKKRTVLDMVFAGGEAPVVGTKDAAVAVDGNINYARRNGIFITPSFILPDGRVVQGLQDAEKLKKLVEDK